MSPPIASLSKKPWVEQFLSDSWKHRNELFISWANARLGVLDSTATVEQPQFAAEHSVRTVTVRTPNLQSIWQGRMRRWRWWYHDKLTRAFRLLTTGPTTSLRPSISLALGLFERSECFCLANLHQADLIVCTLEPPN